MRRLRDLTDFAEPLRPSTIRTGPYRTEDHDDEPTLIIPSDITREWRRRLRESTAPERRSDHEAA